MSGPFTDALVQAIAKQMDEDQKTICNLRIENDYLRRELSDQRAYTRLLVWLLQDEAEEAA